MVFFFLGIDGESEDGNRGEQEKANEENNGGN